MTLPQVNALLERFGVRVHRVCRRGLVRWVILQPAYTYDWSSWRACVRDIQEVVS